MRIRFQILTNVRRATISVVRINASIRMDRLTVHALTATSWTLVTTKRAPMWTNVQTKRYPISDVLIIASICPEAPNASARLATSFVPIRKLAKVRETEKLNFFEKEREKKKKIQQIRGKDEQLSFP